MSFTVAIVGRPNVGKSTLFNRLVGRRSALVADEPGVTRDRRSGQGRIGPLRFTVIDTAGLEEGDEASLQARTFEQTRRALEAADVALFVIDGRLGVSPEDHHYARYLRRFKTPVVLVVNKCEGKASSAGLLESYALALGEPVAISAEHGEGLADLYDAIAPFAPESATEEDEPAPASDEAIGAPGEVGADTRPERPLALAIVGRPNVGKSSLINRLLGEERVITGPEAGLTRDAIAIDWRHQGRAIRLIDTAGLRRKSRVEGKLEKLSVGDTLDAIRRAEVVIVVIDASLPVAKQDFGIAALVVSEGRAPVLALNKWDLVAERGQLLAEYQAALEETLSQAKGIRLVPCAALTGEGVAKLMPAVLAAYEVWNRRLPTGELNRWLEPALSRHPPPLVKGRRLRLRYMTQVKARPPTFVAFANHPLALPESYVRYLVNGLRERFGLDGVPIRFSLRKGDNPYQGKGKRGR